MIDKQTIISFTENFFKTHNKEPNRFDFEQGGIEYQWIFRLFGGLKKLFEICCIPSNRRDHRLSDDALKEYLDRRKVATAEGCWIIPDMYSDPDTGRNKIWYQGKKVYLYRLSYKLYKGVIENGKVIAHSCDNPLCFNPEHLSVETQQENIRQSIERKRNTKVTKGFKAHRISNPYDYRSLLDYVQTKITKTEKNEWLYQGCLNSGYAVIQINKVTYQLHKLILANKLNKKYEEIEIARHKLPDGSKPQKNDLNPDHLFEGTQSENMRDSLSYNKTCKLTKKDVQSIADAFDAFDITKGVGVFDTEMGKKFGVNTQNIKKIRYQLSYNNFLDGKKRIEQKEKAIVQLTADFTIVATFSSATEAASVLGYHQASISKACISKKMHKGYFWFFC